MVSTSRDELIECIEIKLVLLIFPVFSVSVDVLSVCFTETKFCSPTYKRQLTMVFSSGIYKSTALNLSLLANCGGRGG